MFSSVENKYKIYIKYFRDYFTYLLLINASFYFLYIILSNKYKNFSPYKPDIEKIKIGNGSYAKIGIISDFQLSYEREQNGEERFIHFSNNLNLTLKYFKEHGIDLLIIAGDITNNGQLLNLLYFKKIFYSVYDDNSKPLVISIMGNHDFYDFNFSGNENKKKFYKVTNSFPNSHYIINGFNFIFWSQDNHLNSENGYNNYTWIKNSIEFAQHNLNKKGDPIFIFTHNPPKKTVYGSETIWGHSGLYYFLKNYHEVICISGHSHYSLRNIKSIWQGEFTVINTQSISYVDLDPYFENFNEVRYESGRDFESMGLIAHLTDKNIIFERVEFSTGEIMEEKWKIDFPINVDNFTFTFDKRNKNEKPVFHDDNIKIEQIQVNNSLEKYIVFNAATHSDYIYKYKIILKNVNNDKQNVLYYYSDYYKNEKKRQKIMKFKLPKDEYSGTYNLEIYAIDSFDNTSEPIKKEITI